MRLNPTLAKEQARRVAEKGMVLWRQVKAAGSSNNSSRISLAPAQIRQVLNSFAAESDSSQQFVQLPTTVQAITHAPKQCATPTAGHAQALLSSARLSVYTILNVCARRPTCRPVQEQGGSLAAAAVEYVFCPGGMQGATSNCFAKARTLSLLQSYVSMLLSAFHHVQGAHNTLALQVPDQ
jgi:hypothetical protein